MKVFRAITGFIRSEPVLMASLASGAATVAVGFGLNQDEAGAIAGGLQFVLGLLARTQTLAKVTATKVVPAKGGPMPVIVSWADTVAAKP